MNYGNVVDLMRAELGHRGTLTDSQEQERMNTAINSVVNDFVGESCDFWLETFEVTLPESITVEIDSINDHALTVTSNSSIDVDGNPYVEGILSDGTDDYRIKAINSTTSESIIYTTPFLESTGSVSLYAGSYSFDGDHGIPIQLPDGDVTTDWELEKILGIVGLDQATHRDAVENMEKAATPTHWIAVPTGIRFLPAPADEVNYTITVRRKPTLSSTYTSTETVDFPNNWLYDLAEMAVIRYKILTDLPLTQAQFNHYQEKKRKIVLAHSGMNYNIYEERRRWIKGIESSLFT